MSEANESRMGNGIYRIAVARPHPRPLSATRFARRTEGGEKCSSPGEVIKPSPPTS
jgi:hypothetical protein